jgi:hypothetical protein
VLHKCSNNKGLGDIKMKVKELIAELEKFTDKNPEVIIRFGCYRDAMIHCDISEVGNSYGPDIISIGYIFREDNRH